MQAQPLYQYHYPTHHWRGGIAGYEQYPELEAIVRAAKRCYERPLYFAVGDKIYTLEDRVWNLIKEERW